MKSRQNKFLKKSLFRNPDEPKLQSRAFHDSEKTKQMTKYTKNCLKIHCFCNLSQNSIPPRSQIASGMRAKRAWTRVLLKYAKSKSESKNPFSPSVGCLVGKWPPMMMRCSHKLELLLFALISIELWNFKDLLHEKPSSRFFSAIFAMAWWVLFFVFLIIIPTKMHTGFKFRVLIWRRRGRFMLRFIIRLIFGKIQYKSQHERSLFNI